MGTAGNDEMKEFFGVIQPHLKELFDTLFSPRSKLNLEEWTLLQKNPEYLDVLENIRKDFDVPHDLSLETDLDCSFVPLGDSDMYQEESTWIMCLKNNQRKAFKKTIRGVLDKYKLPLNFSSFITNQVLYRKTSASLPLYNWDILRQIMDDPKEAARIGLSNQEKKSVLWLFRYIHKISNGRIPKKYQSTYTKLKTALSKSKNKKRRSRSFDESIKIIELKKEMLNPENDKSISRKIPKNYLDVVAEMNPDDSGEDDARISARTRKRASRINNRVKRQGKK